MKILAISDTHGKHRELDIEDMLFGVDTIVHSGDISNIGRGDEVDHFMSWFHSLPVKNKIFILGNHEVEVQGAEDWIRSLIRDKYDTLTFLHHETVTIDGIKIFGSPYTPYFHGWAYNVLRKDLEYYWDEIEPGTDLIITHGPAFGVGDMTRHKEHVGCKYLLDKIVEINPQAHQFGHIHEDRGIHTIQDWCDTKFINASNVQGFPYRMVQPMTYTLKSKLDEYNPY